mmetsp:Transcript_106320/g.310847  ORF Transcript_106320/g.310847 Transcript_106320/m.310847 type:complete len:98 (-) Transcript_106320:150-443(-)
MRWSRKIKGRCRTKLVMLMRTRAMTSWPSQLRRSLAYWQLRMPALHTAAAGASPVRAVGRASGAGTSGGECASPHPSVELSCFDAGVGYLCCRRSCI